MNRLFIETSEFTKGVTAPEKKVLKRLAEQFIEEAIRAVSRGKRRK